MLIAFFLCWGSFLNVVGYRLIEGVNIVTPRSFCPHCKTQIVWYDNIPVLSWIFLRGACRSCKTSISILYPFIELLTAVVMTALFYHVPLKYFFSYFIFISALIVTIRSDLETMLISRYVTVFLIPVGFVLSFSKLLPITPQESIVGTLGGYLLLFAIAKIFYKLTGKHGLGQGDVDLIAFIGSFIGFLGCWATILVGSVVGSIIGLIFMLIVRSTQSTKIPFGPFLAGAAISYIFFQDYFLQLFFNA